MATYLQLYAVSDSNIAILKKHPPYIQRLLNPDIAESMEHSVHLGKPLGFWASVLVSKKAAQESPPVFVSPEGATLDLDRAWPGIHFLLTGSAQQGINPQGFLIGGGSVIGEAGDGWMALSAAETREIAQALAPFDRERLRRRYHAATLHALKIAPQDRWADIDDKEAMEDDFVWLFEYFEQLQVFLKETVANGLGMVKEIS